MPCGSLEGKERRRKRNPRYWGWRLRELSCNLREQGTIWGVGLLSSENVGWAEMKAQVMGSEMGKEGGV